MSKEPPMKKRKMGDGQEKVDDPPPLFSGESDDDMLLEDAPAQQSTDALHRSSELHFENEFSRLIGTLGKEALLKLQRAKVLLVGLSGLGVEVGKNITLMGVASLTLHDPENVVISDLSSQFFLRDSDIGKNRAEATLPRFVELNERVKMNVDNSPLTEAFLKNFTCVVMTNNTSREVLLKVNAICHENHINFIAGDVRGLFGWLFNDFGHHTTVDATGENPSTVYVESITSDVLGLVTCVESARHNLQDGDIVRITEVEGMTELNGKEFKVAVKGPYSFSIGDTTKLSAYKKGGFVEQIKTPVEAEFKPLADFFGLNNVGFDQMLLADKYERGSIYPFFVQGLLAFRESTGSFPTPGSSDHAQQVVSLVETFYVKANPTEKLDDSAKSWIGLLAKGSAGTISPMCAIFGGIIGQEIIKAVSSKYTPIRQFFFNDALECLPSPNLTEDDCKPLGSRYDGQIAVFGRAYNDKLRNLKYFLVGSGAIGCEMLKCWSMMGIGSGEKGHVDVTDLDTIEISNLNRQFLFRPADVSKFKSATAANAVKKMNPDMKITSRTLKVGPDTENIFNDEFWTNLDGVCNALDNMQARLYVDNRCVFYKKSLLESGTQGTKGNTQVVVPYMTESYGSSVDPPPTETPVCLLHSFPNNIEHCMQWARELLFEGHFVKDAEVTNNYLDSDDYISKLSPTSVNSTYETLNATLIKRPKTFDECIVWSREIFEERFSHAFKQLLYNFPKDYVDQQGVPFWSGAKRPPTPITFDAHNDLHLSFIVSSSFLMAYVCGIFPRETKPEDLQAQIAHIRAYSSSIKVAEFVPKQNLKIETDMKVTKAAEATFTDADEQRVNEIKKILPKRDAAQNRRMHPVTFEKDDDTNFHIDFIHAASNLRAYAYNIPTVDRLKSKLIAGKIIPAIVTTTALVVGFINLELYKVHSGVKKIEDYRNTFVNLAIPIFSQGEPIAPKSKKYLDKTFTLWDRIDIEIGDATLKELIDYFEKELKMSLDMLGVGQSLLYASWAAAKAKERMNKKVTDIYDEIMKEKGPLDRNHVKFIMLEPTATDLDGNDIADLPQIAFWFSKPAKKK